MPHQPRPSFRSPRFAQPPTFMRLPHVEDARGLDVAIVGVPFDGGTSYRPGARMAPREIRAQSSLIRSYSYFQKVAPFDRLNVADIRQAVLLEIAARAERMQADAVLYQTILDHNGISAGQPLTDEQLVTVYRDWKVLTKAIVLTPTGDGYTFDYVALRGPVAQQTDFHVAGSISANGRIATTFDEPTRRTNVAPA
jgi:hypothetical protein